MMDLAREFPETDADTLEMAQGLLKPFDCWIPVHHDGHLLRLPDRNNLWRGLQFWGMVTGQLTIDFSRFCLAGNCRNCAMVIQRAGQAQPETALACQTLPEEGMTLLELPDGFRYRA